MNKEQVGIHIGEYHASAEPVKIYTLLGSCVAVCLHDPYSRIGGMNHILLPGKADINKFDVAARYGVNAMELLINRMMKLGASRRSLRAKVFGGGHVLPSISRSNGVGQRNVSFVLEFLRLEKIRVSASDVGGTHSRKVLYHTDTDEAFVKKLPSSWQQQIVEQERLESGRLRKKAAGTGEVIIFDR